MYGSIGVSKDCLFPEMACQSPSICSGREAKDNSHKVYVILSHARIHKQELPTVLGVMTVPDLEPSRPFFFKQQPKKFSATMCNKHLVHGIEHSKLEVLGKNVLDHVVGPRKMIGSRVCSWDLELGLS